MARVNNIDTTAETPLPQLKAALEALGPGQKIGVDNTREEIMRTRENLYKRRHEIPGADDHIEYIEALLLAEAQGHLDFKK